MKPTTLLLITYQGENTWKEFTDEEDAEKYVKYLREQFEGIRIQQYTKFV
jgi:hypothetical protein